MNNSTTNTTEKKQKFLVNVLGFLFINATSKIAAFILIPLSTNVLTTTEYGLYDVIINTATLMVTLLTINISDGVFRFILVKERDNNEVVSTGIFITLGSFVVSFLVLVLARLFRVNWIEPQYYTYISVVFILMAIYRLEVYYHKGIDNVKKIGRGVVIQSALFLLLTLVSLYIYNWGLKGFLYAYIVSYVVADLDLLHSALQETSLRLKWNWNQTTEMIKYSVPLALSSLAWWVNGVSDRYILLYYKDIAVVGVYAISNKIPAIINVLYAGIISAFQISTINDTADNDNDGFWFSLYKSISMCMAFICLILIMANVRISALLFSKDFFVAWKYAPILICGMYFKTMGDLCLAVSLRQRKSGINAGIIGFSAVINILCNFLVIPFWGAYGAAISTLFCYICMFIMSYLYINKHFTRDPNLFESIIVSLFVVIETIMACYGEEYIIYQSILVIIFIIWKRKEAGRIVKMLYCLKKDVQC